MRTFWMAITLGLILVLSGVSFLKNVDLHTEKRQLHDELNGVSQKNSELQRQYDQPTCAGRWENNKCLPFLTALTALPKSGTSPLSVTFTARVPDMNYSIDFGDGTLSWLSRGPNQYSAGECIPDKSGLCTVTLDHVYETNMAALFKARLKKGSMAMQNSAVESTATIKVTPPGHVDGYQGLPPDSNQAKKRKKQTNLPPEI